MKKIEASSKGKVDTVFWQKMFNIRLKGNCNIDLLYRNGWIVRFFSYTEEGRRKNLKRLYFNEDLPSEIINVEMDYLYPDKEGIPRKAVLELRAGFIGLKQSEDFTLEPQIGWMIRRMDMSEQLKEKLNKKTIWGEIELKVDTIPLFILSQKTIHKLSLDFSDKILIPDKLGEVEIKIKSLFLSGKIEEAEKSRLVKLFPNTELYVNGEKLQ